jgi:hypothetical protein
LSIGTDSIPADKVYDDWVNKYKLHINFLSLRGPSDFDTAEVEADIENAEDSDSDPSDGEDGTFGENADHSDSDPSDGEDGTVSPRENTHLEEETVAVAVRLQQVEELTVLPEEKKRAMSHEEAHIILRSISIGCFCRLLWINVDSSRRIRPLVDPGPDHDFDLLHFHTHFVEDGSGAEYEAKTKVQSIDYLPRLGETVQRHVFPHPIRTYDVATLYLIVCTGGGHKRCLRKGFGWLKTNITTAVDFLLHSIVIRTLGKTHPLKSWCEYSRVGLGRTGTWFLPGVGEMDDFLGFVRKAIEKTGKGKRRKNECHDFTSEQFLRTLDDQFKTFSGLHQVLSHWKLAAKTFLVDYVNDRCRHDASANRELFIRKMLDQFVRGGCSENGDRLKFVCSQVCADLEELIDDEPFGAIEDVCCGPGSKAGYAVWNGVAQEKYSKQLKKLSDDELMMQGLEKGPRGVRVTLNKRLYSQVDLEHGSCKIGVFVPKLPGGGGSISVQPRKQAPHCHPVCTQSFEEGISEHAIQEVREIACRSVQAFKRAILSGKWKDPGGIMGEKCWSRPDDYMLEKISDKS